MRNVRLNRLLLPVSLFILFTVLLVGPWPVINTHWESSHYAQQTLSRLAQMPAPTAAGQLSVGSGVQVMPLKAGMPIGGYADRTERNARADSQTLQMRAISISNGHTTITLAGGDYLLPLPELVDRVLTLSHLPREAILFTATHTHSGPGGYAQGLIEERTLGEYNPAMLELMAQSLSQAIIASRQNLQPARLIQHNLEPTPEDRSELVHSYFKKGNNPVFSRLQILQALEKNSNTVLATLISFPAHPTLAGREASVFDADYPGVIQHQLAQTFRSPVMFVSGAMGAMMPAQLHQPASDASRQQNIEQLGQKISTQVLQQLTQPVAPRVLEQAELLSWLLPVKLPSPSYEINAWLRASPFLVNTLFHNRQTYIHAVKIGPMVMLGFPADFSGELAIDIHQQAQNFSVTPWVISFNGDYIGYVHPASRYRRNTHITRDAVVYGQWGGEYLAALGLKLIKKME